MGAAKVNLRRRGNESDSIGIFAIKVKETVRLGECEDDIAGPSCSCVTKEIQRCLVSMINTIHRVETGDSVATGTTAFVRPFVVQYEPQSQKNGAGEVRKVLQGEPWSNRSIGSVPLCVIDHLTLENSFKGKDPPSSSTREAVLSKIVTVFT